MNTEITRDKCDQNNAIMTIQINDVEKCKSIYLIRRPLILLLRIE